MQGRYKIVTLCGSTRFKDDFFRVQKELTLEGNIVISVGLFGHSGDDEVWTAGTKEMLDDMHFSKIDMADEIFVVNPGGYVGESTAREIGYALMCGKAVKSIVPIHLDRYTPECGFNQNILNPETDEERLMTAQWNMSNKVWNRAIANKLMTGKDTDNIWPIYDGVADAKSYLLTKPKVMIVLKEPYDDTAKDNHGRTIPYGGGWDFPMLLKAQSEDHVWPNRTWQRVIYAIYGFRNGKHYSEMDSIQKKPIMGDVLLDTCWINLSKMPGFTSSSDNKWKKAFDDNWNDIFVEQVKLYNPDVIIFGGTFDLAGSYVMDNQINGEIVWSDDRQLSLTKYRHKDRLILAAAHPGIRHNVDFWVNSIIGALNDFSKTL